MNRKAQYRSLSIKPIVMLLATLTPCIALSADNFNIEVSNNDIAVQAYNASLRELLLELEKRTGIPVKFVTEDDERVSLEVGLTTVENAIGKITPNHMIVHEDKNGEKVIKELIIIPNTTGSTADSGGNSSFLPSGQPASPVEPELAQPGSMPLQPEITEQKPNLDGNTNSVN